MDPTKKAWLRVSAIICLGLIVVGKWAWHMRKQGYLDSIVGRMAAIPAAEDRYARVHPETGYSCQFSELGLGKPSGYEVQIRGCGPSSGEPNRSFQAVARPLDSELPALCIDQNGPLRYSVDGSTEDCVQRGEYW